jgi:hexosaminidase
MGFNGVVVMCVMAAAVVQAARTCQRSYTCIESTGECNLNPTCDGQGMSAARCRLSCGSTTNTLVTLWPQPTELRHAGEVTVVSPFFEAFEFVVDSLESNEEKDEFLELFEASTASFVDSLNWLKSKRLHGHYRQHHHVKAQEPSSVKVEAIIEDRNHVQLDLGTNESYLLHVSRVGSKVVAIITAPNFFGFRHGLETLSNLFLRDELTGELLMNSNVDIFDQPRYPYRGVTLDVSRHFLPIQKIKKIIQAMSFNKMNSLHLHLTDSDSFPVEITKHPNLTFYGAYNDEQIYTRQQLGELMRFALSKGIRVVPEIDSPAHVRMGWEWGEEAGLGPFVLCTGQYWDQQALEPPSGQLNIVNENAVALLEDVWDQLVEDFSQSTDIFHIGGDEVLVGPGSNNEACYNSSTRASPVVDFLLSNGFDINDSESFYGLWINFTQRITEKVKTKVESLDRFKSGGFKFVVWGGKSAESKLIYNLSTRKDYSTILDPSMFAVEVWDSSTDSIAPSLLEQGFSVILAHSDRLYMDCGSAGWPGSGPYWCNPYTNWMNIYSYIDELLPTWKLNEEQLSRVLGAETLAWTEFIDETTVEQKLWPRSAALAEALWNTGPKRTPLEANERMQLWRSTLVNRGILAEPLQAQWCDFQSPHYCALP